MVLTSKIIFNKNPNCKTFEEIFNLDLWGNDLEDISIIKKLKNIKVLSLSVNKITSLKDFQYCDKLEELFIRKNLIKDLNEIKYLSKLENLKILWLSENPCFFNENYRKIIIYSLPQITHLDDQKISEEERIEAFKYFSNQNQNQNQNLNQNSKSKSKFKSKYSSSNSFIN
ncbi:leucine rich repeat protein [Anaeramoeba ignava]|uniref:Leucine rich repeat protein n=1 Tax=Anaeramoeba ignava TaxID=1746090 RepID=A0A9Q0L5Q4_ANAIG|nr:leucine rich repeat protein [Anaeramoeba ignava]